eukprot:767256-Hanusia_phi.AAC.3
MTYEGFKDIEKEDMDALRLRGAGDSKWIFPLQKQQSAEGQEEDMGEAEEEVLRLRGGRDSELDPLSQYLKSFVPEEASQLEPTRPQQEYEEEESSTEGILQNQSQWRSRMNSSFVYGEYFMGQEAWDAKTRRVISCLKNASFPIHKVRAGRGSEERGSEERGGQGEDSRGKGREGERGRGREQEDEEGAGYGGSRLLIGMRSWTWRK